MNFYEIGWWIYPIVVGLVVYFGLRATQSKTKPLTRTSTYYYTIQASTFVPMDGSIGYTKSDFAMTAGEKGKVVGFAAPVHLPHGAKITCFEFGVYDNCATENITAQLLCSWNLTDFASSSTIISKLHTSGQPKETILNSGPLQHSVDTKSYYFAYVQWTVPDTPAEIKAHSARITYTILEPAY